MPRNPLTTMPPHQRAAMSAAGKLGGDAKASKYSKREIGAMAKKGARKIPKDKRRARAKKASDARWSKHRAELRALESKARFDATLAQVMTNNREALEDLAKR